MGRGSYCFGMDDDEYDDGSPSCEQGGDEGADDYKDFDFLEGAWGIYDDAFEPENRQIAAEIQGYDMLASHWLSSSLPPICRHQWPGTASCVL